VLPKTAGINGYSHKISPAEVKRQFVFCDVNPFLAGFFVPKNQRIKLKERKYMPNNKNVDTVKELREKVAKAKAMTFADLTKLKGTETSDLRQQIRAVNSEVVIAKNTLLKVAMKEENVDPTQLEKDLAGPTAVVFSYSDAVEPIKALVEASKKFGIKIKAALLEGKYNTGAQVELISTLPSKEQLLGQFVGLLNTPVTGFVRTLNGVQTKFVRVLAAVADSKKS
jgi:large subunit ribosomal protein L10